jgi:hypothetical protein
MLNMLAVTEEGEIACDQVYPALGEFAELAQRGREPLCQEFPEFRKLLQLRNDISHGEVEKIIPYLDEISHLRQSAKDIITMFLNCTELDIRNIHYQATMEELAQRYEKKGLNNFG